MVWFVIAIIAAAVALIGLLVALGSKDLKAGGVVTLVIGLVIALGTGFAAMAVTNDEGQAKVLRSWTGEVQGEILEPGFTTKAPWQTALTYDIRNQQVIFADSKDANGPTITVQDREGVSANIDIAVRYSIKPDAVVDVYKRYGNQEAFISKFIENDIKAGLRTVPAQYGTLEFLNNRSEVETKIIEYLEQRWEKAGVRVETVSLQDIRYPDSVKERFAEAQNARTEVEKASAELERNKIQAESNEILAQSLKPENLEQLKWETLRDIGKSGNLVIVPEDFGGMINLK